MTGNLQDRIAGEIRAELGRRQMTQSALAVALERSEPYVSLRVSGKTPWNVAELERVAGVLGVPVVQFFGVQSAAA